MRYEDIIEMKQEQIVSLESEIKDALEKKHMKHAERCEEEIKQIKFELANPTSIIGHKNHKSYEGDCRREA